MWKNVRNYEIPGIILAIIIIVMIIMVATKSPTLEHVLLAGLIGVTTWYAYSTIKIARTTKQQAEIMLNGQFNAVAPVIELDVHGIAKDFLIVWRNIGMGPALNFRCWIEDEQHPEFRNVHKAVWSGAVARDGVPKQSRLDTEIRGYQLGIGYLRAQYESVFGKTYESCLLFPANAAPELKYGEAKEVIIL